MELTGPGDQNLPSAGNVVRKKRYASKGKGEYNSHNKPLLDEKRNQTNPSVEAINPGIKLLIDKIKNELKSRGANGFIGLQRKFRIMDDDGSKSLSLPEFRKAMKEMTVDLSDGDLRSLFQYFDSDLSGAIDFEEFIQGVRDPLSEKRVRLVKLAFAKLDKDNSGVVDGQEIASVYDASKHPDVISKRKTSSEVLREFLDTFDVGGVHDGMVTQEEFINYYTNIGAAIQNDDYFELMIRNAWHISGGEGQAANTSNRRVLVTMADGSQRVTEIQNDLGLAADDEKGMASRLKGQGIDAVKISRFDGGEDNNNKIGQRSAAARPLSASAVSNRYTSSNSYGLKEANILNNVRDQMQKEADDKKKKESRDIIVSLSN